MKYKKKPSYYTKLRLEYKKAKKEKKQKNVFFNKDDDIRYNKIRQFYKILRKNKKKVIKIKEDLNFKHEKYKKKKKIKQCKEIINNKLKNKKIKKLINKFIIAQFKDSVKKKKKLFFFKKLFFKKTLVKRMSELYFKKDIKLKNATAILKNNKKFKFLTFPINSICKFFFKNSMYNIFMTLVVLPINLTIGNYSGGHFNILSKRRDRGSINSLKSMAKLISLKIYQSNLSFIIFCPRLFTNNNKRLIKTIFYSFKILNRSPITKIYLYRPVIRNGIRSKKLPRK